MFSGAPSGLQVVLTLTGGGVAARLAPGHSLAAPPGLKGIRVNFVLILGGTVSAARLTA